MNGLGRVAAPVAILNFYILIGNKYCDLGQKGSKNNGEKNIKN